MTFRRSLPDKQRLSLLAGRWGPGPRGPGPPRGPPTRRHHPSPQVPYVERTAPMPPPRTRGALLGFCGKFLEQVLAAGDRRAVQVSGAAQNPCVTGARQSLEPRAEGP